MRCVGSLLVSDLPYFDPRGLEGLLCMSLKREFGQRSRRSIDWVAHSGSILA
jgi:hypothetical protein